MDYNTKLDRHEDIFATVGEDLPFVKELKQRPEAFDEVLSNLNELSDVNAMLILGYAVMNDKRDPDLIKRVSARRNIEEWALDGYAPLHLAACAGRTDMLHTLLALGAPVDGRNVDGRTALHLAVLCDRLEFVQVLIISRADVEACDMEGLTPLHYACDTRTYENQNNKNDIAIELIKSGADMHLVAEDEDEAGFTPVTLAIAHCNVPLVEAMVEFSGMKPPTDVGGSYMNFVRGAKGAEMEEIFELLVNSEWCPRVSEDDDSSACCVNDQAATTAAATASFDGESPLHRATTTGELNTLMALLQSGENPDVLNPSGCTPLHVAAQAGNVAIVEALVSFGCAIVIRTPKGLTPLHFAAMEGHVQVAEILLAASSSSAIDAKDAAPNVGPAAADARDNHGRCPLFFAAQCGKTDVITAFVKAHAALDRRDNTGRSPLCAATRAGEAGVVKALLKGGASADARDKDGLSLLHKAVMKKHGDVVEALLEGGASPGAGGEKGETPLHAACRQNPAAVSALLRAGALPGHCWNAKLQSPLFVASESGNVDAVRQLLPRLSTRQVNLRDVVLVNGGQQQGGNTALLTAIMHAHVEIVDMLLAAGADPSIRAAANGMSPLDLVVHCCASAAGINTVRLHHKAVFARDATLGPRLVRALVEGGAEVNEVDPQGLNALQTACSVGSSGHVVQALLDAGADVRAPCAGHEFLPSLHLAAYGGNPEALRVLAGRPEYGDLNELGPAPDRCTPLGYAVYYGQLDAVRYLLEEGADMEAVPLAEDNTPMAPTLIHLAAACGHADVISLLLQARHFKESESMV